MVKGLFGREKEIKILQKAWASEEAEMVSVIGRRRVGKTFLINRVYADHIVFKVSGIQNAPLEQQLRTFTNQLKRMTGKKVGVPKDWLDAFFLLIEYLEPIVKKERKVIFLDELPWLAAEESDFLIGLDYFWNNWAGGQNLVLVICGSAASWIIKNVVNHRGGLHNRITKRIHLSPFTLAETEQYLRHNNIHFDRYQLVQLYMALGGIPHYLKEIQAGESAIQNINRICFAKGGLLRNEFSRLYTSLFPEAHHHIAVIRTLAQKRQGLLYRQIQQLTKIQDDDKLSEVLEELDQSGFIGVYRSFSLKPQDKLYRLTDEYSLFYLHFIEGKEHEGNRTWHHLSQTQAYKIWSGYTFESLCLKHIRQIKKALGIEDIYSLSSSFYKKGTSGVTGAQIDLLIDRNDHVINLFEIKYYNEPFTLTKAYITTLKKKMEVFKTNTQTQKQLLWIFLSIFGLKNNVYSKDRALIAKSLTIDALFED